MNRTHPTPAAATLSARRGIKGMNVLSGALHRFLDLFRPAPCPTPPDLTSNASPVGIPAEQPAVEVVGQAAIATSWNQNRATITALTWTIRHNPTDPVSVHTLTCDQTTKAARTALVLDAVHAILQQADTHDIRVELFWTE